MRVVLFATLGIVFVAVGLAAAQPPVLPSEVPPAYPSAPSATVWNKMPTTMVLHPQPPSSQPVPTTPPAKAPEPMPPMSEPAATLPPPTQIQPPPQPAYEPPSQGRTPVAPWAADMLQSNQAASPLMNLAQYYNIPYRGPQMWGNLEYVMYWIRPAQIKGPLVMTTVVPENLANSTTVGSVIDPNAAIVLGYQDVNFGTFIGMRTTGGFWFDRCQNYGYQGSFFLLEQRSQTFVGAGGTGPAAQPAFTVPFNSVGPGPLVGETAAVVAGPFADLTVLGTVGMNIRSQLFGGDADLLANWWKGEFWRIDGVLGYKYLNLDETLTFRTVVLNQSEGRTTDVFQNINAFNGGEIGTKVTYSLSNLGFEGIAKFAIGGTHQIDEFSGASIQPLNFGGKAVPGGFFVLDSNMGRETHNRFSTVTDLGCNIWYEWNASVRTYVGCNYLYWTNILRPGNQIDRNINPNLSPTFGGDATGVGLRLPRRINVETDFWALGLSLGMSFTW